VAPLVEALTVTWATDDDDDGPIPDEDEGEGEGMGADPAGEPAAAGEV